MFEVRLAIIRKANGKYAVAVMASGDLVAFVTDEFDNESDAFFAFTKALQSLVPSDGAE